MPANRLSVETAQRADPENLPPARIGIDDGDTAAIRRDGDSIKEDLREARPRMDGDIELDDANSACGARYVAAMETLRPDLDHATIATASRTRDPEGRPL